MHQTDIQMFSLRVPEGAELTISVSFDCHFPHPCALTPVTVLARHTESGTVGMVAVANPGTRQQRS